MDIPLKEQTFVRYYYLPAREAISAELIVVLHSRMEVVRVPMRQEDIELSSFFKRSMTSKEVAKASKGQLWKVFSSWDELLQDHRKMGVEEADLQHLLSMRSNFPLPKKERLRRNKTVR